MSVNLPDWPIEVIEGVAVVTMNANKANAINTDFVQQLVRALDRLEHEELLKQCPVVLTGHGGYFSAGFDLKAFATGQLDAVDKLFDVTFRLLQFPRPVIAAVNGHCMAAGFFVALSCDLLIACEGDYKFALTEILIGMPFPSLGIEILRAKVPYHVSARLALLGIPMSPAEAQQAGLVFEVVSSDKLIRKCIKLAKRIPVTAYPSYAIIKQNLVSTIEERLKLPESKKYEKVFSEALKQGQQRIVEYMQSTFGSGLNASKSNL